MPTPIDLWLIAALGFLGSFGHCVGMCGPIAAAFALSFQRPHGQTQHWLSSAWFHLWLNLGRLLSYALVGAGIGALGSVVLAGGQMAGVGSEVRRVCSVLTGVFLIWFGLSKALPNLLPAVPLLHPDRQARLHERLTQMMLRVSAGSSGSALAPLLLGLLWGLIPCGFLYASQLRAAETQSWLGGAAIMTAFGAGTLPAMLSMGMVTSILSSDRRSQLFRMGGWLTTLIGLLLLLRTGDTMSDYSGHAALICLMLALAARPVSRLWAAPLQYRRLLGVGAFGLSVMHGVHMASHTWNWQFRAVQFMLRSHQFALLLGTIALLLMLPAALTSFDAAQKALGNRWRRLHLLSVPALILAVAHTLLIGSSYWGSPALRWQNYAQTAGLLVAVAIVLGVRRPHLWSTLSLSQHYASIKSTPKTTPALPALPDPDRNSTHQQH